MKKLIIIEDDNEIRAFLELLLGEIYKIKSFSSIKNIIEENINIYDYDLVLSDYLTNDESCDQLIDKYPQQKFIVISGYTKDSKIIKKILEYKNVFFIEKPFSSEYLLSQIENLLTSK